MVYNDIEREEENMGKRIFGLLIILAGVLLLLDNLNIYPIKDLFDYLWPSALILIGVYSMIEQRRVNLFHLIITMIGLVFLAISFNLIERESVVNLILPSIIILFGLTLVFGRRVFAINISDKNDIVAVFGGAKHKSNNKQFEKYEVSAVFGSADVDLSDIELKGDKGVVSINAVFGGADVRLPRKYAVKVIGGGPVFGGFEDKTSNMDAKVAGKVIEVNYSVVFGAIEIRD
jgi:predicted membrane protein